MASNSFFAGRADGPPFVKPFLHALNRMQERETLQPEQLVRHAVTLLEGRLGASPHAAETAFTYGCIGLLSEHTHFFDGFALLMPLPYGTAVAVRRTEAPTSQVLFEGDKGPCAFDLRAAESQPPGADRLGLAEAMARRFGPEEGQVEVAVVSTVQEACKEAYWAALGVAAAQALQRLCGRTTEAPRLLQQVRDVVALAEERPFSLAYARASEASRPGTLILVDTAKLEQLALDAPPHDVLGWGLVDPGTEALVDAAFYRKTKARADRALQLLQQAGLSQLASFRDIDHQDLPRVLELLPRRYRSAVHYLVTENHRVQKLVAAVRRRDQQMLGALLLMSHAAQRADYQGTNPEVDCVVEQVEAMSIEGMYGAALVSTGGCVLVAGQPFTVPQCLDRIKGAFEARFGRTPAMALL